MGEGSWRGEVALRNLGRCLPCFYLPVSAPPHATPTCGFLGGSAVKNPPASAESQVPSLGWEDPLEKEMATRFSILAWEIPWTEEPGGLQPMRVSKESDTTQ